MTNGLARAARYAWRTNGPPGATNPAHHALSGANRYASRNIRRLAVPPFVAWYATRNTRTRDQSRTIPLPGGSSPASKAPRIARGPSGSIALSPGMSAASARRFVRVSATRRIR
jgi:hypothetical protein